MAFKRAVKQKKIKTFTSVVQAKSNKTVQFGLVDFKRMKEENTSISILNYHGLYSVIIIIIIKSMRFINGNSKATQFHGHDVYLTQIISWNDISFACFLRIHFGFQRLFFSSDYNRITYVQRDSCQR